MIHSAETTAAGHQGIEERPDRNDRTILVRVAMRRGKRGVLPKTPEAQLDNLTGTALAEKLHHMIGVDVAIQGLMEPTQARESIFLAGTTPFDKAMFSKHFIRKKPSLGKGMKPCYPELP